MPRTLLCCALALGLAAPAVAGTLLVGNKSGQSVSVLDLASGETRGSHATGVAPHEIVISPNGALAVVANYGASTAGHTLTVIDLAAGAVARTVDLGTHTRPHGLSFLPDGRRVLATTEGDGSLTEVDAIGGTVLRNVALGDGKPHMVAVSPDASTAYVTQVDGGVVSVVDLAAFEKVADIATGAGAEGVAVAQDGEVWVSNRAADTVSVIDPGTRTVAATLPSVGFPIRVALTPDGAHAIVTNAKAATLSVFARKSRALVATIALAEEGRTYAQTMLGTAALPIGVRVAPDGSRVFAAVSGGDEVAVIDAKTWQVTARWPTGREPDALAIPGAN